LGIHIVTELTPAVWRKRRRESDDGMGVIVYAQGWDTLGIAFLGRHCATPAHDADPFPAIDRLNWLAMKLIVAACSMARDLNFRRTTMSQVPFEFDELRGDDLAQELDAMMSIGRTLSSLRGPESRARALRWALDRFMPPTDIDAADAGEPPVVLPPHRSEDSQLLDAKPGSEGTDGHNSTSPFALFEREKQRARRKRHTVNDDR
jgi:hypothetical protein